MTLDEPKAKLDEFSPVSAFTYVADEYEPGDTMEAKIKQCCAYEHGLKRKQVLDVLAIELRDILTHYRTPPPVHAGSRG